MTPETQSLKSPNEKQENGAGEKRKKKRVERGGAVYDIAPQ